MSKVASDYIIKKIKSSSRITLGLATGGTPEGTYKHLINDHRRNGTSYKHVTTVNLDEYVGLSGNHQNSYQYYMRTNLFDHIDINQDHAHLPKGDAIDIEMECKRYEELIENIGGVDLQLLGIGKNGHIGFNEPGTSFQSKTHVVTLASSTREANARYFDRPDDVPTQAITMGIGTIVKSKEILLLIAGESKKEAFKKLIENDVDESFPASILKKHHNVKIIVDEKAALSLEKGKIPISVI